MTEQPLPFESVGFRVGPVGRVECEAELFRRSDYVIGRQGRGRGTGGVVVSRAEQDRDLELPGEVDHVVIFRHFHLRFEIALVRVAEDMGPAARSAPVVTRQVAESGIVGPQAFDPRIEGGGDDGQRSALAPSAYGDAILVDLGQRAEEIDGPDAPCVDVPVIILLAVVDVVIVIAVQRAETEVVVEFVGRLTEIP